MFDVFSLFPIVSKKLRYLFILVCSSKSTNIQGTSCCFHTIGNNGYSGYSARMGIQTLNLQKILKKNENAIYFSIILYAKYKSLKPVRAQILRTKISIKFSHFFHYFFLQSIKHIHISKKITRPSLMISRFRNQPNQRHTMAKGFSKYLKNYLDFV